MQRAVALVVLLWAVPTSAQHQNRHDARALEQDPRLAPGQIAPVLTGLGDHHHAVTTDSERAQLFFDQGLKPDLRVQPPGGATRLQGGGAARSRLRDGVLGLGAGARSEPQLAHASGGRGAGLEGGATRSRKKERRRRRGARDDRGTGPTVLGRPFGRPRRAQHGIRRGHGRRLCEVFRTIRMWPHSMRRHS